MALPFRVGARVKLTNSELRHVIRVDSDGWVIGRKNPDGTSWDNVVVDDDGNPLSPLVGYSVESVEPEQLFTQDMLVCIFAADHDPDGREDIGRVKIVPTVERSGKVALGGGESCEINMQGVVVGSGGKEICRPQAHPDVFASKAARLEARKRRNEEAAAAERREREERMAGNKRNPRWELEGSARMSWDLTWWTRTLK